MNTGWIKHCKGIQISLVNTGIKVSGSRGIIGARMAITYEYVEGEDEAEY
jgi:hypothetical protein